METNHRADDEKDGAKPTQRAAPYVAHATFILTQIIEKLEDKLTSIKAMTA
jgi:hypothetical protein